VMQLAEQQAAGPVNVYNPYLEDEQWDMEAMVLSTIAGQLEDEEEEEKEVLDQAEEGVECGECDEDECDNEGAFGSWALEVHSAANRGKSSCEDGCTTHSSTPSATSLAIPGAAFDVKSDGSRLPTRSDGSRLPTSGTALERKEQHFQRCDECEKHEQALSQARFKAVPERFGPSPPPSPPADHNASPPPAPPHDIPKTPPSSERHANVHHPEDPNCMCPACLTDIPAANVHGELVQLPAMPVSRANDAPDDDFVLQGTERVQEKVVSSPIPLLF
jgi:hypothetical protein